MALDATKWQVTAGKAIEYTGPAHGLTGANYVTGTRNVTALDPT